MDALPAKPKRGTHWAQIFLGLQTGIIVVLLASIVIPTGVHPLENSPASDMIDLQKAVIDAKAAGRPMSKFQIESLVKSRQVEAYRFELSGTENIWLLTCAHDDSDFYDGAGYSLILRRFRPHSVFILSSADASLTMVTPRASTLRYESGKWVRDN